MKVKLTYFRRESGKYYTEGEYDTKLQDLNDIWKEIKNMKIALIRSDFIILVNVPEHPFNHPKLII
jgi:hypothetical protein